MSKPKEISGIVAIIDLNTALTMSSKDIFIDAENGTTWRIVSISQLSNFIHRMQGSKSFWDNIHTSWSNN